MKKTSLLLIALLATSCIAARDAGSAPSVTPSAAAASASLPPTLAASSSPTVSARLVSGVGGRVQVSPDGKWIALTPPQPGGKGSPPWIPTIELHNIDGKLVRSVELPTPNWSWMPDSSGLFVWLDAPQRPASLGVLDITGTAPRATGLMMADQTLSRDGRWIIAVHAAGCCMFVTYPEIRVAPRSGGDARTLVTANADPKGIALLGIDAADRVVYRDAGQILRIAISGGTPQLLGSIADFATSLSGDTSPDGMAILVRGYEPQRWYLIANDRPATWVDSAGTIVEDLQGERLLFGRAALWTGPHRLLVRAPSGELSTFDALTGQSTATKARLGASDLALAFDRGRLLVGRGNGAAVIDLATGRESDVGIDAIQSDGARASRAWALPSGGFILSTITATYRID